MSCAVTMFLYKFKFVLSKRHVQIYMSMLQFGLLSLAMHSEEVEITSVVPQGSVLGPIFFLIYINDMGLYTKHSSAGLFADNTIIYITLTAEMTAKVSMKTFKLWRGGMLTG